MNCPQLADQDHHHMEKNEHILKRLNAQPSMLQPATVTTFPKIYIYKLDEDKADQNIGTQIKP